MFLYIGLFTMHKSLSFLLVFALLSCSHRTTLKDENVITVKCESEFKNTPLSNGQILWQKVAVAGGIGGSYLMTGLGYSTDLIISFTGGIVGSVVVCSPLVALDVLAANNAFQSTPISAECLGNFGTKIGKAINPKLGPAAQKHTEKWKCPDLDSVAEGLMKVSQCYSSQGQNSLAREQILKMKDSSIYQLCLSENLREKIDSRLEDFK